MNLRPYQYEAITNVRESYRSGSKSTLLVLPTGAGKTVVFSYVTKQAIEKNNRVLILVHRDSLFKQTSKTLGMFGVRHGLICSGYTPTYYYDCQVAKIGTMINKLDKFKPDLIIVDEAHHATASTYRRIIDYYDVRVLGVTATPVRTDGVGLGDMFNDLIVGTTINALIEMGFLVAPRIFAPDIGVDLSNVKKTAGDFNKSELVEVMDKPTITGDAVKHYIKYANNVPSVAFCVSVKHCEHVSEMFRLNGIASEPVHGGMKQNEIDSVLNGLATGKIKVVTSCDIISEGTDIPLIGCVIMLRPTHSESLYLQQAGRGLRPCEGKTECIILDHVGNTSRHGHPCEDRDWSLESKKKRTRKTDDAEQNVMIRTCESCYYVFKPAPICPCCGWEVPKLAREIEQVDGELVEFQRKEKKKQVGRARTLEELRIIEKERGYKRGWAEKIYNSRK